MLYASLKLPNKFDSVHVWLSFLSLDTTRWHCTQSPVPHLAVFNLPLFPFIYKPSRTDYSVPLREIQWVITQDNIWLFPMWSTTKPYRKSLQSDYFLLRPKFISLFAIYTNMTQAITAMGSSFFLAKRSLTLKLMIAEI